MDKCRFCGKPALYVDVTAIGRDYYCSEGCRVSLKKRLYGFSPKLMRQLERLDDDRD